MIGKFSAYVFKLTLLATELGLFMLSGVSLKT